MARKGLAPRYQQGTWPHQPAADELRGDTSTPRELRLDRQEDRGLTGTGAAHRWVLQLHPGVVRQSSAHPGARSRLPAAPGTRWRRGIAAGRALQSFLPGPGARGPLPTATAARKANSSPAWHCQLGEAQQQRM